MPIVGGLDIHRKQITFDYLDTATGEVRRGQIAPADRGHLAGWLAGRFTGQDAHFAVEGCTGWRYVAEELAAAGITLHVGEPADTAALRGRKRHAKTDKTDSRHLRVLLADGRLPECWIPPSHVLECRALLELYHDLRTEHTAWVQRIHAALFHQGAPAARRGRAAHRRGPGRAAGDRGRAAVAGRAAADRGGPGQAAALEGHLDVLRRRLVGAARQLTGARELHARLYGVGPGHRAGIVLLAGRGGPVLLRPQGGPVHRAGHHRLVLGPQGPPGRLSRQGPEVLRWCVYEAGKTHARRSAPDHAYYARSRTGSTASAPPSPRPARSSARPCISWPHSATTR